MIRVDDIALMNVGDKPWSYRDNPGHLEWGVTYKDENEALEKIEDDLKEPDLGLIEIEDYWYDEEDNSIWIAALWQDGWDSFMTELHFDVQEKLGQLWDRGDVVFDSNRELTRTAEKVVDKLVDLYRHEPITLYEMDREVLSDIDATIDEVLKR